MTIQSKIERDLAARKDLASRMSEKERIVVTFDRSVTGLQVIKMAVKGNEVLSVEKYKADVAGNAKNLAIQILNEEIMKLKKAPPELD